MVPSAERKTTMMRDETQSVAVDVTDAMMKMLRQPVLNTFLIAFNQHESPAENRNEANPFFGLFALMDRMDQDALRLEALTPKRKTGEPPEGTVEVAATDPDLEDFIAETTTDMEAVLRPSQTFILETAPVRDFFKAVRETNRELRKARARRHWLEEERRQARIAKLQARIIR